MQVIEWHQFLENGLPVNGKASVTIGVFDGVHRGHQFLIERVVSHNVDFTSIDIKSIDVKPVDHVPVVITFRENHKGGEKAGNIQSFQEKIKIFERLGVKITLVIDFTESFRRMKGIEFLETLLKHGNIGFFAVGKSFRCGYQLDTDAAAISEFFAAHGVQIEIIDEVMEGSQPISSSRIRAAIADGDHQLAQAMLGRIFK